MSNDYIMCSIKFIILFAIICAVAMLFYDGNEYFQNDDDDDDDDDTIIEHFDGTIQNPISPPVINSKLSEDAQNINDMFNADNYIPKIPADKVDWLVDDGKSQSVANNSLIGVYRPIGISSSNGSLRVPNYDTRGSIFIEKIPNLGPWNISTYDADTNLKASQFCGY